MGFSHDSRMPQGLERRLRPFTGWHMAAILLSAFAVVLAVNVVMATLATSTFGGEVVENSYVASQDFNRWLDEAAKERALGWKVAAARDGDGRVRVTLTGVPRDASVIAEARHPLGRLPDMQLGFAPDAAGAYRSARPLPAGRWMLRFVVKAQGKTWRGERPVS